MTMIGLGKRTLAAALLAAAAIGSAYATAGRPASVAGAPRQAPQSSPALLSAWRINLDGHTGPYTLSNGQSGANLADVQLTQQNAANVYVSAAGIPSYAIGPFPGNPATPDEQNYRFRLPKTPVVQAGAKQATGLGPIGVLVNGVPIYNALDAFSWSASLQRDAATNAPPGQRGDGVWNRNANVAEAAGFDSCRGHPAPGQNPANGRYHNHDDPACLRAMLGDDGTRHSPIIGWAFDGYPLYGPYGYADPLDPGSAIRRVASGYRLRAIAQRTTRPDGTALLAGQYGPAVSAQYPLGYYVEDFEYAATGDLDRYNGRFTITPEYPAGTYAYFLSLDAGGAAFYPYMIGPQYYGVVAADNLGAGQVAIPG
ncbi:MAG TPA: YHYH protein, partial [Herpetosiphonaceae bacterium]|nr:YHYH protein [Herpetosiphonaceae bacterium]